MAFAKLAVTVTEAIANEAKQPAPAQVLHTAENIKPQANVSERRRSKSNNKGAKKRRSEEGSRFALSNDLMEE